jgi:hypothetical protein
MPGTPAMTSLLPVSEVRRPTGLRAERKRRAIVAAAREIFVSHGYDAGVDLIADAAGVSKVTIYNHFGSKEQLSPWGQRTRGCRPAVQRG